MRRIFAILGTTILGGCATAFVEVIELDEQQISNLKSSVPIFVTTDLKNVDFDFLGSVKAYSCFNNFILDEPSSKEDAMNQVRYKASIMGADAVINPICTKEGTSLSKNCWSSVTCEAAAIRINQNDIKNKEKAI